MQSKLILFFLLAVVMPLIAVAQTPIACDKGFQQYDGVCLSQRMVEYLVCVKETGANKQGVSDLVRRISREKSSGAAEGKGSGIVISGSGKLKLSKESDSDVVRKLETTFFPGGASGCAAIVNGAQVGAKKVDYKIFSNGITNTGALKFIIRNEGATAHNTSIVAGEHIFAGIAGNPAKNTSGSGLATFSFNGSFPSTVVNGSTAFSLNATPESLVQIAHHVAAFGRSNNFQGEASVSYYYSLSISYEDDSGTSHKRYWRLLIDADEKSADVIGAGFHPINAKGFEVIVSFMRNSRSSGQYLNAGGPNELSIQKINCGLKLAQTSSTATC